MTYSKTAFIFPIISQFNLPLFLLFSRIFKFDIYYIEISNSIEKPLDIVTYLELHNIKWMNKEYKKTSEYMRGRTIASEFSDLLWESLKKSLLIELIEKNIIKDRVNEKATEVLWKNNIYHIVEIMGHQYAAAQFLLTHKKYEKVRIISNSSLSKFLGKYNRESITIHNIPLVTWMMEIVPIFEKVRNLFKRKGKKTTHDSGKTIKKVKVNETKLSDIDVGSYEIAFFPHQGIFYGNLFIKDQFYNEDVKSPFYKSKILHFSLGEKNEEYMKKNYDYYKENQIPFMDFYDIKINKRQFFLNILSLSIQINVKLFVEIFRYGISFVFIAVIVIIKLLQNSQRFLKCERLKLAFAGYDFLFPPELSIALMLKGIKVCASQERFIQAFYDNITRFIFDYYFVAGEVVKERGLKNCFVKEIISVGLPRVDKLFAYEKNPIPDQKYDRIKKYKKLVLALDYHLPLDDYENNTRSDGKVEEIRIFYLDLIKLAQEFPQLFIVIKGKSKEQYLSCYIEDIVKTIDNLENIDIERDLDIYDPYHIAEKADLTIACHTSLADELLAAGRRVIFYEMSDYMETYFHYDDLPLIVKDYDELKYHVKRFIEGIYLDKDRILQLQRLYSNSYDGKVKERIHENLHRIIEKGIICDV